MTAVDRHAPPDAAGEVNAVDEQVVDSEQQESGARKQGQLGRRTAEELRQDHG